MHDKIELQAYATFKVLVGLLLLSAFVMVGIVVFWHKSDDSMGLLGSLSLVLLGIIFNQPVLVMIPPTLTVPAEIVALLGNACSLIWGYLCLGTFTPALMIRVKCSLFMSFTHCQTRPSVFGGTTSFFGFVLTSLKWYNRSKQ